MNYTTIPSKDIVNKTSQALASRNFEAIVVSTKAEALEKIKELIPQNSSVNNGSSTTLKQIGYIDYLKEGKHGWNNLHEKVAQEKDEAKAAELRKAALYADYYLGSAHALTEDGQLVIASATGSQLPPLAFTSQNIILVVSTKKITANLDQALTRLREHVYPLEDERMKSVGQAGSVLAKILILEREAAFMGRKVTIILMNEDAGF